MNLRLLLTSVLLASTSACVTLPEPPTALNEYEFEAERISAAQSLPYFEAQSVNGAVCVVDPVDQAKFEAFIVAADANTRALTLAIDAYYSRTEEARYLLYAGREAENQARVYYEVANGNSAMIERLMWPATGLGGLMLLLIAL
jgi:hypothetical protein